MRNDLKLIQIHSNHGDDKNWTGMKQNQRLRKKNIYWLK